MPLDLVAGREWKGNGGRDMSTRWGGDGHSAALKSQLGPVNVVNTIILY